MFGGFSVLSERPQRDVTKTLKIFKGSKYLTVYNSCVQEQGVWKAAHIFPQVCFSCNFTRSFLELLALQSQKYLIFF